MIFLFFLIIFEFVFFWFKLLVCEVIFNDVIFELIVGNLGVLCILFWKFLLFEVFIFLLLKGMYESFIVKVIVVEKVIILVIIIGFSFNFIIIFF